MHLVAELPAEGSSNLVKNERAFEFVPAAEFEGLKYTRQELEYVRNLVAQADHSVHDSCDASPVGSVLESALPPLSLKEERALFKRMNYTRYRAARLRSTLLGRRPSRKVIQRIESLLAESLAVRGRLSHSYIRLVVSLARKFARRVHDLQDLVSDGMLILLAAIDKFDYTRGFRFSTYLTHSLQRAHCRATRRRQRLDSQCVSVSADTLARISHARVEEFVEVSPDAAFRQLMDAATTNLEEREQSILHRRFGTDGESQPQTLRQIAADLGMSKERVRQIQARAMTKLKNIANGTKLATAVN